MTMAVDLQGASQMRTPQNRRRPSLQNLKKEAENKKQSEALQGFKDALKQL
jgi:hypothetical protein